ncbi:MAG: hypothetical protein ACI9H9_000408 [Pseudoalteromonas tetraodonis]|jgi:hypothetical protein|uniref:Uncharacterized protein n=1 Tax=Pseudoalteromonas issachenkonii TaxID=152297 RepID=A0ABN5C177_9GAMM|nr:hypothetical protein PSM_A1477 [Pseudoalteromonas sp. SM9913]ATC90544.1 hypothetical protein PISS_a1639 [Pseudoalteromonas issachenkonii]ATD03123.1 hypothetical protein PTET_a1708 [Pseudoalteromonas tetraodonis]GAA65397.1 hypothetical protein P20311_3207 [Pseudoalteromonas sp. BSi20311]GAA71436.1 hypothetical protein P20439_1510 [Pseudoalteromonas sp. BSi20439]
MDSSHGIPILLLKPARGGLPNRKSGAYGARILRFFYLNAKKWMIMRFLLLAQ